MPIFTSPPNDIRINNFPRDPERERKWQQIAISNPQRVADIFDLTFVSNPPDRRQRTRWGDAIQDIQPVEMCITAIASSPHMSTEWHALVRVGIIERLCECVNGTRQTLNISATQTRHSRVRLEHSKYYLSLQLLVLIGFNFVNHHPSTNEAVISTICKYWPSMMTRLWLDIDQTENAHEEMQFERSSVGMIIYHILNYKRDPTFVKMLQSDDDLTTRLIFRYWVHSTGTEDIRVLQPPLSFIYNITNEPDISALKVLCEKVLRDMVLGANSFRKVIQKIEWALTTLRDTHTLAAILVALNYLVAVASPISPSASDVVKPDFLRTMLKANSLWKVIVSLLFDITRESVDIQPMEDRACVYHQVVTSIQVALNCQQMAPIESANCLRALARNGLFDGLDQALPPYHADPKILDVEQAIKPCLHQIMKLLAQQPSLLSSLRVHLPRPRCLRALLDAEYVGRGKPPPPQVIPRDALPLTLPDTTVTQHIRPWLYWDMIQEMCQMQKQCMRRGCKNRRRARCGGCKMMEYCGHPCQKQDWEEHRLICGFGRKRLPIGFLPLDAMEIVSMPSRLYPTSS